MKTLFNWKILLFIIVGLASFLRFYKLGAVPSGVTNDELGYIYNSYSIAVTGKNIFGELLPFLTFVNPGGFPFLPIPTYLSVPLFWLLEPSAAVGRLASAFLGTIDILLVFVLARMLFNKISLALVSALFLAISPWHLHLSRSAYDPNFSLFFYLLAIVLFIYEIKERRLPIFSITSFFLAIFSYRGMNVIFVPIILVLIWYGLSVLKMKSKQLIVFSLGISFILISLACVIVVNGKSYTAEALSFNGPKIQEDIDTQIREAKGPLFIRRIFLNKLSYSLSKLRENYLKAYSPEFLFLNTEPNSIYSIWSRGRIYILDLVFIVLGSVYLFKINKKSAFFIISMVFLGGLPGMVGGLPYSARNFFLSAFFPILSSAGIIYLLKSSSMGKFKNILVFVIILSYSYLFSSYIFDYYGRYAFYGSESWFKGMKDLSLTIVNKKDKYNNIIVSTSSFSDLLQYAFYAKINPSQVQNAWKKADKIKKSYSIGNITFGQKCIEKEEYESMLLKESSILYIAHDNCNKLIKPNDFIRDYHENIIWKIYNINK